MDGSFASLLTDKINELYGLIYNPFAIPLVLFSRRGLVDGTNRIRSISPVRISMQVRDEGRLQKRHQR